LKVSGQAKTEEFKDIKNRCYSKLYCMDTSI